MAFIYLKLLDNLTFSYPLLLELLPLEPTTHPSHRMKGLISQDPRLKDTVKDLNNGLSKSQE